MKIKVNYIESKYELEFDKRSGVIMSYGRSMPF